MGSPEKCIDFSISTILLLLFYHLFKHNLKRNSLSLSDQTQVCIWMFSSNKQYITIKKLSYYIFGVLTSLYATLDSIRDLLDLFTLWLHNTVQPYADINYTISILSKLVYLRSIILTSLHSRVSNVGFKRNVALWLRGKLCLLNFVLLYSFFAPTSESFKGLLYYIRCRLKPIQEHLHFMWSERKQKNWTQWELMKR